MAWRIGLVVAMVVAACAGRAAAGEELPPAPMTRVGVVKVEDVFTKYQYLIDTNEEIKRQFGPEEEKILSDLQKLEQEKQNLGSGRLVPAGTPAFAQKQLEIMNEESRLEIAQQQFLIRMNKVQIDRFVVAHTALFRACRDFGAHFKYDLILLTPALEAPELPDTMEVRWQEVFQALFFQRTILFVNPDTGIDITDRMILHMNRRYENWKRDPKNNAM